MRVYNAKTALAALVKARDLDLKATNYAFKASKQWQRGDSGRRSDDFSERYANEAAALFLQVEHYLTRLI